jgi:hypothetical protein
MTETTMKKPNYFSIRTEGKYTLVKDLNTGAFRVINTKSQRVIGFASNQALADMELTTIACRYS